MAKLKKENEIVRLPLSSWDIFPWTSEMYQRHEQDFQKILLEYREIRRKYDDSARMARWRWIESKGGMKIIKDTNGIEEPHAIESKYQRFSNMFERFNDWLSFKEKRENTPEQLQAKRDDITKNIKVSMSRTSFGMPESVMQGAKRDIEYEKEKQDEVTQSALDNF